MEARPAEHLGGSGSPNSGHGRPTPSHGGEGRNTVPESDIRLTLPARAENVALVRHVVSALAESLAFPPKLIEDIRLAVTEACTNVVRHAYIGTEGPLDVSIAPHAGSGGLTIVVSDRGRGIQPNPNSEGPGLGLPLIAALAHALDIEHAPDAGSRLSMSFRAGSGTLETA
jgi:anti-sigma regulatory factor (Ser/Thr protein kinase)